jgi:hypothetical protein
MFFLRACSATLSVQHANIPTAGPLKTSLPIVSLPQRAIYPLWTSSFLTSFQHPHVSYLPLTCVADGLALQMPSQRHELQLDHPSSPSSVGFERLEQVATIVPEPGTYYDVAIEECMNLFVSAPYGYSGQMRPGSQSHALSKKRALRGRCSVSFEQGLS